MPEVLDENKMFGEAVGEKQQVANILFTQNVHLATFLGTCGCKPIAVKKGPERTQLGHPITKFVYDNSDGRAEEIFALWCRPEVGLDGWDSFSMDEKKKFINLITAHCENLRHFLAEVKKGE